MTQLSTAHSIKPTHIHTNTSMNFATVIITENTPSREQAIVFNSIDGIPQIEYIFAIGKLVKPINIIFVSRISNQRFCIFLSSKQVLDNLMEQTRTKHNPHLQKMVHTPLPPTPNSMEIRYPQIWIGP